MNIDIRKLNSITKYPSIPTYHELADREKDGLKEQLIVSFSQDEELNIYEKIDGENSRIVLIGDGYDVDYFIGSRKELLHAKGDRISIPTGNIANYSKPIADKLSNWFKGSVGVLVIYFESYGGQTPKTKQYTHDKTQYGRVFDAFELSKDKFEELMNMELSKIASWRDNGGQPYFNVGDLEMLTEVLELPTAPLLKSVKSEIPTEIEPTLNWLEQFRETRVGINQIGESEGVIVRTKDRNKIVKIRFEDYEKTMRFRERSLKGGK